MSNICANIRIFLLRNNYLRRLSAITVKLLCQSVQRIKALLVPQARAELDPQVQSIDIFVKIKYMSLYGYILSGIYRRSCPYVADTSVPFEFMMVMVSPTSIS